MLRYRDICERPTQVFDLTSLLPNEFALIVPAFERCFQARMDQWTMTGELQQQIQANVNDTAPTDPMHGPTFEADEVYQNAGEKYVTS
jgi:hypothetical protein